MGEMTLSMQVQNVVHGRESLLPSQWISIESSLMRSYQSQLSHMNGRSSVVAALLADGCAAAAKRLRNSGAKWRLSDNRCFVRAGVSQPITSGGSERGAMSPHQTTLCKAVELIQHAVMTWRSSTRSGN